MRNFHSCWPCSFLVLGIALVTLGPAQISPIQKFAQNGDAPRARAVHRASHAPMRLLLGPDGLPIRGPHNETYRSSNWSGYVVIGGNYMSASATWIVRPVCYSRYPQCIPSLDTVCHEHISIWVGIGGASEPTLVQPGTEKIYNRGTIIIGPPIYQAWFEILPASETLLPYPVFPGDVITTSLACIANCVPNLA
jgi:Peptidase A4 family